LGGGKHSEKPGKGHKGEKGGGILGWPEKEQIALGLASTPGTVENRQTANLVETDWVKEINWGGSAKGNGHPALWIPTRRVTQDGNGRKGKGEKSRAPRPLLIHPPHEWSGRR